MLLEYIVSKVEAVAERIRRRHVKRKIGGTNPVKGGGICEVYEIYGNQSDLCEIVGNCESILSFFFQI